MTPITHGGTDRGYKLCKCAKCGDEHQCTPTRDFFTLRDDPTGLLYCESCMMSKWSKDAYEDRIKEMKK